VVSPNGLGPGEYNLKTYLGEGPLYTIGEKRQGTQGFNYPGPTTYQPEDGQTFERVPHWKFSNNPQNHNGP
jgi:hypothetical protein